MLHCSVTDGRSYSFRTGRREIAEHSRFADSRQVFFLLDTWKCHCLLFAELPFSVLHRPCRPEQPCITSLGQRVVVPHKIRISKMQEGVRTALLKFMEARTSHGVALTDINSSVTDIATRRGDPWRSQSCVNRCMLLVQALLLQRENQSLSSCAWVLKFETAAGRASGCMRLRSFRDSIGREKFSVQLDVDCLRAYTRQAQTRNRNETNSRAGCSRGLSDRCRWRLPLRSKSAVDLLRIMDAHPQCFHIRNAF